MKAVSLYFHVPFCAQRCGYCNFYSTTDLSRREDYIEVMTKAIAAAPLTDREAVTLYFGGGTPSLLGAGLLTLLEAVRERLPVAADAEITLEANPATIDLPTLKALRRGGFNRISFGLQADDDVSLRRLGRLHSAAQGREAVTLAREAGFENISIDLMLGTPGQGVAEAVTLCHSAAALAPEHISAYLLKVESGTPFDRERIDRFCADEDEAADIYLAACGVLSSLGYRHYEVSNFAIPGRESRHNTVYWQLGDYLGLGPSAHSFLEGKRFYFPDSLDGFLSAENIWSTVVSDGRGGGVEEYVMLALRTDGGISYFDLRDRYGVNAFGIECRVLRLAAEGLATVNGPGFSLTDKGFLLSNSVIGYLLEGIC